VIVSFQVDLREVWATRMEHVPRAGDWLTIQVPADHADTIDYQGPVQLAADGERRSGFRQSSGACGATVTRQSSTAASRSR